MDNPKINILSLCSGIGGLDLGIHAATGGRARVVGYVERESYAAACLLARMEDQRLEPAPVWCGNLQDFPAAGFRGLVDGIVGGYPCQPFSVAGRRQGESDERHIFPDILEIIRATEPFFCFFENVPGHLSNGLPGVYQSLASLGFSVEAGIYSAAEVGAPHRRERLFILAHKGRDFLRLEPWRGCWQGGEGEAEFGVSGQQLGDADNQGLERRAQRRDSLPAGHQRTPWPPGPGDDWESVPEWLQPATSESRIRRVADGIPARMGEPLAYRTDKLTALGNAVVPATAEKAFRSLVSTVMEAHHGV